MSSGGEGSGSGGSPASPPGGGGGYRAGPGPGPGFGLGDGPGDDPGGVPAGGADGRSFVVDSSPERSPGGGQDEGGGGGGAGGAAGGGVPEDASAAAAMTCAGRRTRTRTVRAPALVLTRSSAGGGGENEDADACTGDEDGDLPVAFERPVYRDRPRSHTHTHTPNYSYDRQDDLPLIPLWADDPISADCGYEHLSVGRRDLLLARFYGCGCLRRARAAEEAGAGAGAGADTGAGAGADTGADTNKAPAHRNRRSGRLPLCPACRRIEGWGAAYLSREMVRLQPAAAAGPGGGSGGGGGRTTRFVLAVQGTNRTMVRVDGIPVFDEESQRHRTNGDEGEDGGDGDGGNGDGGGWVGNADVMVGSILSIECSRAADADGAVPAIGRLAFVLQNIDVDVEEPAAGRRCSSDADGYQDRGDRAVTFELGAAAAAARAEDSDDIGPDDDEDDEDTSKPTGGKKAEVTGPKGGAAVTAKSPPSNNKNNNNNDDDKGEVEILEIDDSPEDAVVTQQPAAEGASPLVVYFLSVGRKMSHHRIERLSSNLTRKDPSVEVVDSFRKTGVTHVVIDEGVPASQAAEALGFVDEKGMAKVVRRRGLAIVTPKWVFDVDAVHLRDTPAMNLVWPGLKHSAGSAPKDRHDEKCRHGEESQKKSAFDESMMLSYQPTTQHDDTSVSSRDSVMEKSDDDFAAVKKVSLKSLDDDDPAARMLKKKKQIARKYHNVGLFNMFLEVSKLHADSELEELDNYKSKLYAKLAWRLKYLDFEVTLVNINRLSEIDGFGPSVTKKVREYLMTKTCQKITAFREDPLRIAVKNLTEIWGVGKKKAHELARDGVTNICDVRKSLKSGRLELSKNANLGVRYYEDLKEKMERSEVEEITRIVLSVCRSIPWLKDVIITNQGSYRRGEGRCGDADLLLVHPKHVDQLPKGALGAIINKLEEQGHIAHHLNTVEGMHIAKKKQSIGTKRKQETLMAQEEGKQKEVDSAYSYMCIFHSPVHKTKVRRVDLKFYCYQDRAYAALYFTGNTAFNRSLRSFAMQRKDFGLSDHGLFPLHDVDRNRKHQERRQYRVGRIHADSEEEIFAKLGIVWRGPTERKCYDDVVEIDPSNRAKMECLHV